MSQIELLLKKVEGLPPDDMAQIFDFIDSLKDHLKHKAPVPERYRAIEELEGLGKRMGSALTVDRFLEMRHEETEREEAEYRRLFRHTGA
jgi:hypothetical protein